MYVPSTSDQRRKDRTESEKPRRRGWNEYQSREPVKRNGPAKSMRGFGAFRFGSSDRNPFIIPHEVLGRPQDNKRQRQEYRGGRPGRNGYSQGDEDGWATAPVTQDMKEFDLSWKPGPVEKLPDEVVAAYDNWNPMDDFHFSTKNIPCEDAMTTLQGIPHFRGTLCPDAVGNSCYKGELCRYEHHIDQHMLTENSKMAIPFEPTPITHFTLLPLKKLAEAGIYFRGRVTYVRNIHEFYVVPIDGIECECIRRRPRDRKPLDPASHMTVETIMKDLEDYFFANGQKHASSYFVMQLVAIKGQWNGLKGYLRAVMMEEAIVEDDTYPTAWVYCFDIGSTILVGMDNLRMLPKSFSSFPPLAYRCALYGIGYATIPETEEVNDFVADYLLNAKDIIVHVKIPFEPESPGEVNNGVVEDEPYLVDLFTIEGNGFKEFKNVLKGTHDFIEIEPAERNVNGFLPPRRSPCEHGSSRNYVQKITGLPPKCEPASLREQLTSNSSKVFQQLCILLCSGAVMISTLVIIGSEWNRYMR